MIGVGLFYGPGVKLDELRALAAEGDGAASATLRLIEHQGRAGWIEQPAEQTVSADPANDEPLDPVEAEIRRQATELVRARTSPR